MTSKIAPLDGFVLALVTPMNFRTFLNSLCLLEKAGINAEKSNIIADRLVHVFLPIMPILGYNSLEHLRAFGALEPLLVTVLVGREPLLAGELLPARGAMKLLHVDLGVGQIINNTFLLLSQVRDTRDKLFHAFN